MFQAQDDDAEFEQGPSQPPGEWFESEEMDAFQKPDDDLGPQTDSDDLDLNFTSDEGERDTSYLGVLDQMVEGLHCQDYHHESPEQPPQFRKPPPLRVFHNEFAVHGSEYVSTSDDDSDMEKDEDEDLFFQDEIKAMRH